MIVSFPPDIMRPSGKLSVGGMYEIVLMKAEPWDEIEQSYFGGV